MHRVVNIFLAVVVFLFSFASVSPAEGPRTKSMYLERAASFIWINGEPERVDALAVVFAEKGFSPRNEGPKEVSCIVDTFAVLAVGEERGTAITCGERAYSQLSNNEGEYAPRVAEYVAAFIDYKTSPFRREDVAQDELALRNDEEKSCVFLQTKDFTAAGTEAYMSESHARRVALADALREEGYREKKNAWTLCNSVFAKRRCMVAMDHVEGWEVMPSSTIVACRNSNSEQPGDTPRKSVSNELGLEKYVEGVLETIHAGMEATK